MADGAVLVVGVELDDVVGTEVLAGIEAAEPAAGEGDELLARGVTRGHPGLREVDVHRIGEAGGEQLPVGTVDRPGVVDDAFADGDAILQTADASGESGGPSGLLEWVTGRVAAAVKYHFGSREALIAEVVERSGREVIARQRVALDRLAARPDRSTARAWVEAWASPLVRVATAPTHEERRLGRIIGQALADLDRALDARFRQLISEADEQLIRGLRAALPRVDERDLRLRLAFMASALAGLASGTFEPLLALVDPGDDLERRVLDLLVAVTTAP